MIRLSTVLVSILALSALGGCARKWKNGECESSENCKEQAGYGKVCVQGACQECGQDSDCKAGFACKANRCQPRPECESAADCPAVKTCQAGRCATPTAECGPDSGGRSCGPGRECAGGRCLAATPPPDPCGDLGSVYFAFDSATLTAEARPTLEHDAQCVANEKVAALRVEGSCDERGTAEYNMHLGQRRADAVKRYLVNLGVPDMGVSTISFGKEKPVCMEHDESCWQKNRRAGIRAQ
jgi:peptidoglycan-associated lipoprotein